MKWFILFKANRTLSWTSLMTRQLWTDVWTDFGFSIQTYLNPKTRSLQDGKMTRIAAEPTHTLQLELLVMIMIC